MAPEENYSLKRKNFIEEVKKNFEFLISEFGFNAPKHFSHKQPNGTISQDILEYDRTDKKLTFLNAYHPIDYGFEMNLTHKENGDTEMLHFVLKENQDIEQSYIESAAQFLRNSYWTKIKN